MYLLTLVPVKGRGKRALICRACHTSKSKISQTEAPVKQRKTKEQKEKRTERNSQKDQKRFVRKFSAAS